MPRKVHELMSELKRAGFWNRGGKGSHRNFVHPSGIAITVAGKLGDDVPHYLEKQARLAIEAAVRHEQD